jgi:hypothetical protein
MERSRTVWRTVRRVAVASFVIVIAAAWYFYRTLFPDVCHGEHTFSLESWSRLARAHIGAPDRACVVGDLLARNVLLGRTHEQVDSLLGPTTLEPRSPALSERTYYLGPERGPFGIDSQLLIVTFDASGRVSKARLRTD